MRANWAVRLRKSGRINLVSPAAWLSDPASFIPTPVFLNFVSGILLPNFLCSVKHQVLSQWPPLNSRPSRRDDTQTTANNSSHRIARRGLLWFRGFHSVLCSSRVFIISVFFVQVTMLGRGFWNHCVFLLGLVSLVVSAGDLLVR